ncbi:MAG: DNRLRE domain-containing protein [Actinomycetota bacterium]|nr:DNRLRE domain-containing protein [Actinomycetota bacterium]MDQ2955398.1 DNRLRE domain-containing protein [Actinomycetota bacterium]
MTAHRARPRRGWLWPALSVLVVLCLAVAGLVTYRTQKHPSQLVARPAKITDAVSAGTAGQAHQIAVKYDHRVRIASQDGIDYSVFANPDGTKTARLESQPIRVRKAGRLVDIDATLALGSDGYLRPKATAATVRLTDGSAKHPAVSSTPARNSHITQGFLTHAQAETDAVVTPLATMTFGTGSLSYGWYGPLPEPSVAGSSATYAEVLPGIDLRVSVSDDGFEILLVLKSAAAVSELTSIDFPVTITDLAVATDPAGNTTLADADGNQVGVGPAPFLWDSSVDEQSGDPRTASATSQWDADGLPADGTHQTVQHLLLPQSFLADPATRYPVTLDPTWQDKTYPQSSFDYIDQNHPDQTYYKDGWDSNRLHVGAEPGVDTINRAYWDFPATIFEGQDIHTAHFNTTESWSYSCTAKQVDVEHSANWGPSLTWNTKPAMTGGWGSQTVAKGYSSSCPGGAVGFDITSLVTALAASNYATFDLVLKAHDETDQTAWKKFNSGASVEVVFNSYPDAPTALTFTQPTVACGGTSPGVPVNDHVQDLKLGMSENDVDDQGVEVRVHVVNAATGANVLPSGTFPTGYLSSSGFNANGVQPPIILPKDTLPQGSYRWYAYGYDGLDTSKTASVSCYFTVDNTPPAPPSVRVAGLPPSAVGKPVTMKLSSNLSDKVVRFEYWWVPTAQSVTAAPAPVTVATTTLPACGSSSGTASFGCPDGTGATSVLVAPPDSPATFWVASIDAAQNISTATGYQFWAPGDFAAFASGHSWVTDDGVHLTSTEVDDSSTMSGSSCGYACGQPLVLHSATADPANPAQGDPTLTGSLRFNGTTGTGASASSGSPAVDTSKAFTVSAWIRPAALGGYQTAVSQDAGPGKTVSGFYLQLPPSNQWRFCLPSVISATFAGDCVTAAATATVNTWAFVSGVWDPANKQMRLYVNGALAAQATHLSTPVTTGSFVIGRALGATDQNWFHGWIADVSVVPGVADSVQQGFLRLQCPVTSLTCRLLPGD